MEQNRMTQLLSPTQLADFLGVSVGTVYGWIYKKEIPYLKIGRLVRFHSGEVDKWLNDRHVNMQTDDYRRKA